MNLCFMNEILEEKLMASLADVEVLDQNFYMGDIVDQNKKTTTKKKKSRRKIFWQMLKNDFVNKSFITDCFSFILIYMNPLSLEKKIWKQRYHFDQKFVGCLLAVEFFTYINKDENFKKLNQLNLKLNTCHNIVKEFLKGEKNFDTMKISFQKCYIIFQILFGKIFSNYYLRNNNHGIEHCVFSELAFIDYIEYRTGN